MPEGDEKVRATSASRLPISSLLRPHPLARQLQARYFTVDSTEQPVLRQLKTALSAKADRQAILALYVDAQCGEIRHPELQAMVPSKRPICDADNFRAGCVTCRHTGR